jgi:hypothetical protein
MPQSLRANKKRFFREFRGKWRGLSAVLFFFFCVPKRRNKKKAPQPVLALRASLTSRRGRDAEKLGLRPQTVPASFSALVCEARQDKWGKFPLARSRAPERLPKRGFALSERSEFAKPRQHRGVPLTGHKLRESRLRRDKGHRGPFLWFVSLGKQRNERTDFMAQSPGIPG